MPQRPPAIIAFAVLFLAQALITFAAGLWDLEGGIAHYAARYPAFDWNRDALIVLTSARLTIAFIPVALIWFFAVRFARWMCAALAVFKLVQVPGTVASWLNGGTIAASWIAATVLGIVAVAFLFTPQAARWFRQGGRTNARSPD
ncbi:hypothetical protein [Aurantiacibacter poecillastricola]|uniref:hypothetical protein n=1 Tax=Aurantiacibacter poecillastricola TaxID=3064385 RepID=UPI00273E9C26|nr:hypothetical protein [Aurantiacibacter sp. 219JJ12-13]MDP5260570.1 hypothetical protein [Aurantiacibacter sp. 219JJ12-13]